MFGDKCAVHPETGRPLRGEWSGILFGASLPAYSVTILLLLLVVILTGARMKAINTAVLLAIGGVYSVSIFAWFLLYRRCRPWIGFAAHIVTMIAGLTLIVYVTRRMFVDGLTQAIADVPLPLLLATLHNRAMEWPGYETLGAWLLRQSSA
jgi:hypothetical protein